MVGDTMSSADQVAVKKVVKSDLPRPPGSHAGGQKGKSIAKSGAEGRIRTGTGISAQRFLRPPRLPFRHFGARTNSTSETLGFLDTIFANCGDFARRTFRKRPSIMTRGYNDV